MKYLLEQGLSLNTFWYPRVFHLAKRMPEKIEPLSALKVKSTFESHQVGSWRGGDALN
jgi:hypothetical protein